MKINPRRHASGISLTELLIVIVIIVVLALLSFQVTTRMKEKARSVTCIQNLKQIGIGLMGYISENNGRFPDGSADVSWYPGISTSRCWYDASAENMGREYLPYHQADPLPECFGCPSGHGKAYEPAWPYTGDYAANKRLGWPGMGVTNYASVRHPGTTPYVQDTVKQNQFDGTIFSSGFSKQANTAFAARHGGKGNILWVDGRVSTMSYDEYMRFARQSRHGNALNFLKGSW